MAIITAGDLSNLYDQRAFRANGSTVTLKKISETDWLLFGDLAEGDSEGFPLPSNGFPVLYSQDPNQGGLDDYFQLTEGAEYIVEMTSPEECTIEIHPGDASFKWFGIDFGDIGMLVAIRGIEWVNGPTLLVNLDKEFTYHPEDIGEYGESVEINNDTYTTVGVLGEEYTKLLIRPASTSDTVLYVTLHLSFSNPK